MMKLCAALSLFFAVVSAGYLGAPLAHGYGYPALAHAPLAAAYPAPIAYGPAPVYAHAPVVKAVAPLATSYANTYKISVKAPLAVAHPVAAVHAAPAYVSAPAIHAPIAYGHSLPLGYAHSYLH